ncbi:MAG: hypothetical protein ABSE93_02060 [Terriglobia bacterium]|jgi:hypothetical protein
MPEPTPQPEFFNERCRLLRSKWMFIEAEPDPTVPRSDSGICWCVHTQNCLGPDGEIANMENCKPGRACYKSL